MTSDRIRRLASMTLAVTVAMLSAACGGGSARPESAAASVAQTGTASTQATALSSTRDGSIGTVSAVLSTSPEVTSSSSSTCTQTLFDDFIDSQTWDNRRLLPRDCHQVESNPPIFSWRQPGDRDTKQPWTFTLRRRGQVVDHSVLQTASPRLALGDALPAGIWQWTVSYVSKSGATVTSQPRRFIIGADSKTVLFPRGTELASVVRTRPRPRALPDGTSFAELAAALPGRGMTPIYNSLLAEAQAALTVPVPAPMTPEAGDGTVGKASAADMRRVLDQERRYIEALGFAARFSQDMRFRDAGIQRALGLAAWPPDGATSEATSDYSNRAIYLALSQTLDLYSGWLTSGQSAALIVPLKNRLAQAMARFRDLDANPFNSHVDIIVWSVLESLLYAAGTPGFAESTSWLANTWDLLLTTANAWGEDAGGFGNGVAYAWYRIDHISQALAAVRVMSGQNLAHHPSIMRLGDFMIATTAPGGNHRAAHGDATENTSLFRSYAANQFRLYSALTGSAAHDWYWRQDTNPYRSGRYFSPWHLMLSGLPEAQTVPVAPVEASRHFGDVGVTAIHSRTDDPARSSIVFRSSEFGSWNHSHADQNSFTLVSRGVDLLISGGHYPYYLSPHHANVTRSTRFKNALTFDGGIGQAEDGLPAAGLPTAPRMSRDARGRIVAHQDSGLWAASTGDASLAYRWREAETAVWRPLLDEALRTVAYNRLEKVLVIYDYVASTSERSWELNFHGLNPFAMDGSSVRIANGAASACIDVHTRTGGQFSLSSGFPVPPENGAADQHQARFKASGRTTTWVAVTVIREDCRAVPINVLAGTGGQYSVSVAGQPPVRFDRATFVLP